MIEPKDTIDEARRLKELYSYEILDTEEEDNFNEMVELASQICDTPISLITLLDSDRQWFKAKKGLDVSETPRNVSFCGHAIHSSEIMEVNDATTDPRFIDNPLVTENPNIRFYAGVPLVTPNGAKLGTLCVMDTKARELSKEQQFGLTVLSRQVINQLELRLKIKDLSETLSKKKAQNKELQRQKSITNRLISIIAHDLNTPLNTVKAFLNLLQTAKMQKEDMDDFIGRMKSTIDNTLGLLRNLVNWGVSALKNEDNNVSEEIKLQPLVKEILDLYQENASYKDNTLMNHVPDITLLSHKEAVNFIIRNLVQNANKYTQQGKIVVAAIDDTDWVHVSISDNGTGMSEDQQVNLFNWNQKQSMHGTKGEIGSGIGLPMVKDFVDKIKAKLELQSEVGKGTTFTLSLPKQNSHL